MARLLGNVSSDLDKSEGSFIWDALSPAAIELALAYIELDRILNIWLNPYGVYLLYELKEHGMKLKAAVKATGPQAGKITGAVGTPVPINSVFSTPAGIRFLTQQAVTIGANGTAIVDIIAETAGSQGNVPANTITQIPVSIPGVTGFTNILPTKGGAEIETDAAALARLFEKEQNPATSGNNAHYLQWAKEVAGIGDARVIPRWNGTGNVKIIIIDANKQPATADLVTSVQAYIDPNQNGDGSGVAPSGATVTVQAANGLAISLSAALTIDPAYTLAQVQESFETIFVDYLASLALKKDTNNQPLPVSYAQVGSKLIETAGVIDHTNLLINGGTANIPLDTESVPIKGTVTLS